MRFDDMLSTVLAQDVADPRARSAAWRQIADLMAQSKDTGGALRGQAIERLNADRFAVSVEDRTRASEALAGRPVPMDVVSFFAADLPVVAAPLLAQARLSAEDWCVVIPGLPTASRALLRHRRDLPPEAVAMLASFGRSDFAIDEAVRREEEHPAQIRDLVARIEAFRREREERPAAQPLAPPAREMVFETDAEGTVNWVAGTARGAVIGISVAIADQSGVFGVDGQAVGAFRRRAPFSDARLSIPGVSDAAGDWLISAAPVFRHEDGRFLGYRGTARRPRPGEQVTTGSSGLYGTGLPADSLRQLVHELRTPLNAILGFAEMIDRQMLGPAASAYRTRAHAIVGEANRLLRTIDDLDTAARIEADSLIIESAAPFDLSALVSRLARDHAELADGREVSLRIVSPVGLPLVATDPRAVERIVGRLMAATVGVAARGEVIDMVAGMGAGGLSFWLSRPAVLHGKAEATLLDPGYGPEDESPDAPLLGLGFSLRLIDNLARAAGIGFSIEPGRFVLILPVAEDSAGAGKESG